MRERSLDLARAAENDRPSLWLFIASFNLFLRTTMASDPLGTDEAENSGAFSRTPPPPTPVILNLEGGAITHQAPLKAPSAVGWDFHQTATDAL